MQGSHHQQVEMVIIESVESEKHDLIVDLFICVIVVRKAQAADTEAPISGKRAKGRTADVLINTSLYDTKPLGCLAPCPLPGFL